MARTGSSSLPRTSISTVTLHLGRYRPVCRAFPKTGVRPRFFASAQVLQAHPDRIAIVETQSRHQQSRGTRTHAPVARRKSGRSNVAAATDQDEPDDDFEEDDTEPTPTIFKGGKGEGRKEDGGSGSGGRVV